MATNPNISFKRGLQQDLPVSSITDGAFYLTKDTHRLYVGIDSQLVNLSQNIRVVSTELELYTLSPEVGDFAYVKEGNMLVVYKETLDVNSQPVLGWVQINSTDATKVTAVAFGRYSDATKDTKQSDYLSIQVNDAQNNFYRDCIKIIGEDGVRAEVAEDGSTLTIAGCTYAISGQLSGGVENVAYEISLAGSNPELDDTSIVLKQGSGIVLSSDKDNELTISAVDKSWTTGTVTAGNNGHLSVTFKNANNDQVTATSEESVVYFTLPNDRVVNNQQLLDVYTTQEINNLFKDLNPMRYIGTVSSADGLVNLTKVQAGDTYMANTPFDMTAIGYNEQWCAMGDLFIATGVEASGYLTTVEWTYIPSGDGLTVDSTYGGRASVGDNCIDLIDQNLNIVHSIKFTNTDKKIGIASTAYETYDKNANGGLQVTLSHSAPGEAATGFEKSVESDGILASFSAVSGLTIDATGHVSSYDLKPFSVPTYELSEKATVKLTNSKAEVTTTLLASTNDTSTSTFLLDASKDDSLVISVKDNVITLSLEWGTF